MPIHDWTRVGAGDFHDFHVGWVAALRSALNNGVLPIGFSAKAVQLTRGIGPAVLTLRNEMENNRNGLPISSGAVAIADAPPKVSRVESSSSDFYVRRRRSIVVRSDEDRRIVAVIEIISPGNKDSTKRLGKFVSKALTCFERGYHLSIIDLHPPTKRDPNGIHDLIWREYAGKASPLAAGQSRMQVSYSVDEDDVTAYQTPAAVGDVLAHLPLFLEPDRYVELPLETTYMQAFAGISADVRRMLTV